MATIKEITVQELKELIDNDTSYQLIDVREEFEKQIADIGGDLLPLGSIEKRIHEIDPKRKVIVYCRSGKRSAKAIEIIKQSMEHNDIHNLKGGILEWSDKIDHNIEKY